MVQEVTTIRLLALAYAKGRLSRSEYLQKRGQQLSALEFGQTQPPVDETNTLLPMLSEEISFLKNSKVRYFQGMGDAAAAARMRTRSSDNLISDSERQEYRSNNRLIVIVCLVVAVGVLLQVAAHFFESYQTEIESAKLEEILRTDSVDLAAELNLKTEEPEKQLSRDEYDKLALEFPLGAALSRVLSTDLGGLSTKNVNEIIKMIGAATPRQKKILASTSWFGSVVVAVGEYSEKIDQSTGSASSGQKSEISGRNIAFLQFYGDLSEIEFEFEESEESR